MIHYSEKLQDTLYSVDDELEEQWPTLIDIQKKYFAKHKKWFSGAITEEADGLELDYLKLAFIAYPSGFVLIVTVQVDGDKWQKRINYGPDESRNRAWKQLVEDKQ